MLWLSVRRLLSTLSPYSVISLLSTTHVHQVREQLAAFQRRLHVFFGFGHKLTLAFLGWMYAADGAQEDLIRRGRLQTWLHAALCLTS